MGQQSGGHGLASAAEVIDGIGQIGRVPVDDGGDHQVQARGAELLRVLASVGDATLLEGADDLGERVALLGYGTGVGKALAAADILAERGMAVTVADARFAKPIDAGLAAQLAAEHDLLVTVEEGVLAGGFGSAVWETLSDAGLAARILRVGLPDRYVTHGSPKLLHEEVGFTGQRIAERIEAAVAEPSGVAHPIG